MTHMKLTAENLKSLLEVLEMEDDTTDPDSFDRLCAMAVRDAIELNDRIAELNAEVERLRVAVTQGYEEGFKAGVKYQAAEDDTGLDYWTAWNKSIARNALREG